MNEMTTIDRTQREYSDAVKKALQRKPQLYINGEWVDSSGGATIDVEDPSSGKVISSTHGQDLLDTGGEFSGLVSKRLNK